MKNRITIMLLAFMIVAGLSLSPVMAQNKVITIDNSNYVAWMTLDTAQKEGIMKKWGDHFGYTFKYNLVSYDKAIDNYINGRTDVVAITIQDLLMNPRKDGKKSDVVVITSYSDGADGVAVMRAKKKTLEDLIGRETLLKKGTINEYLLYRGLDIQGIDKSKISIVDTNEEDIVQNFLKKRKKGAAVAFNPYLGQLKRPGVKIVFSSKDIPGEIADMVVADQGLPEEAKLALALIYRDVTAYIGAGNGPNWNKAVAQMANAADTNKRKFKRMLTRDTHMFWTLKESIEFMENNNLKTAIGHVRNFCFNYGYFSGANSVDDVGISFPDGSTVGNKSNVLVNFTTEYMKEALTIK